MATPRDIEAKLYMRDAAMRNLSERVQVDEADGRGVRMMKAICGGILPQPGGRRRRPTGNGSVS
jgi:hypothetical protein